VTKSYHIFQIQLYSCKANLTTQYKTYGGVEAQVRAILISELDEGEWSSSRPGFRAPGIRWMGDEVALNLYIIGKGEIVSALN
jgi:hypothetical protein